MAIEKMLVTSSSPHAHSGESTAKIMWTVSAALVPPAVFAIYSFGLPALWVVLATIAAAVGFEAGFQKLRGQKVTVQDGSAFLTGLLLALNLPPSAPWWMCLVGGFVAVVVAKGVFGGLGQNAFNPALTARVFLLIAFPVPMTMWLLPGSLTPQAASPGDLPRTLTSLGGASLAYIGQDGQVIADPSALPSLDQVDMVTSASPLGLIHEAQNGGELASHISVLHLFHGGAENGSLGEVSALLLLLGGLFLLWKKIITWEIPVAFLGTMAIFAEVTHAVSPEHYAGALFHLSAGGAMIGAWFMATDYVSSPTYSRGKLIFGAGCGLLTMVIRLWGGYPEGVSFAILLMNAVVPLIDRSTKPRKFGFVRLADAKEGS